MAFLFKEPVLFICKAIILIISGVVLALSRNVVIRKDISVSAIEIASGVSMLCNVFSLKINLCPLLLLTIQAILIIRFI